MPKKKKEMPDIFILMNLEFFQSMFNSPLGNCT